MDRLLEESLRLAMYEPWEYLDDADRLSIYHMLKSEYEIAIKQAAGLVDLVQLYHRAVVVGIEAERRRRATLSSELSKEAIVTKAAEILGKRVEGV